MSDKNYIRYRAREKRGSIQSVEFHAEDRCRKGWQYGSHFPTDTKSEEWQNGISLPDRSYYTQMKVCGYLEIAPEKAVD